MPAIPPELPVPDFYSPEHAARWSYRPDPEALFARAGAWRREHRILPAAAEAGARAQVHLLLIDLQKDFCLPEGSLYVGGRSGRGAIEDSDRIARFLYRNLAVVTAVTATLDTHFPFQIFFPSFWVDAQGMPLSAHREITAAEVRAGAVRPDPDLAAWLGPGGDVDPEWLTRQAEAYCAALEQGGRYRLYLWPPHCLLGSAGHALTGVIQEARLFHAFVRRARSAVEVKGGEPLTESYSAFSPEVLLAHDGSALGRRHTGLIDTLLAADALIVAGQAASHCVKSTIEDLLSEIAVRDPARAGKVYLLEDCMSAVAVRDPGSPDGFLFDFTPDAEAALARFAAAGMRVVRSTDPVVAWPGFPL
ncbi:MAG TPA: nicotinamidase [Thermoanaerobaculia bacterium]|jgi:nicotinamidase-related amidase|nr:nicotinamidase [Thermoanaerobaculia bacterium]